MSTHQETTSASERPRKQKEFTIPSMALNIVIPVVVLIYFSGEEMLGPLVGLLVALGLPLGYGLFDLIRQRRFNFFSALGVIGILGTGGIGLFKLDVQWIAYRQLILPLVIALVILGSLKTRFPVVKVFLNKIVDLEVVYVALREKGTVEVFDRRLRYAAYFAAASFTLSGIMNFVLAKIIVVSPTGTTEFNEELGKMVAIELPVIGIPFTIMLIMTVRYVLVGIRRLSGLRPKSVVR